MRSWTYEPNEPLFLVEDITFSPFFCGHVRKDKYQNDVSEFNFPDIRFDMVHHVKEAKYRRSPRQTATIYAGVDCFVKFNSYYSERDTEEHSLNVKTAVGDFDAWWGDGEPGGLKVPECFKDNEECIQLKQMFVKDFRYWDNEPLTTMHILSIIHRNPDHGCYFDKKRWEVVKASLIAERAAERK